MNLITPIRTILLDLRARIPGKGTTRAPLDVEPPLRSELLSADQMEQHGASLAGTHALKSGRGKERLLGRLAENELSLIDTCDLLGRVVQANRRIAPAGEWLLDNFYLIDEQIRTAKRHLPEGYSRELPRLADGPSAGLPRVYDIALEAISHSDARLDSISLSRFVAAYQKVIPLKLGELWAIPIMLRLSLIENLRRVGMRIAADTGDRNLADAWADQMTEIAEKDPKSLILMIADMARSSPPISSPFVSEFARRLQGQSPALALPLTWIELRLAESGLTIAQCVQAESQSQAANQVSVSNSIGSLRFLGAMDWREFTESLSVVEQTLREDPAGTYDRMDFATRDRYRRAVEKTAKASKLPEEAVAREAIRSAQEEAAGIASASRESATMRTRAAHVGFHLVDQGLPHLERAVKARFPAPESLRRAALRSPLLLYLGTIALITIAVTVGLLAYARATGAGGWVLALLGALLLLCASHLAIALVNWLAISLATPHLLPRMDFSDGIPPAFRTLVVVPTLLANSEAIENLTDALEVRFLANRQEHLHFGLLTDFLDAKEETLATDAPLLRLAREGIENLNRKYSSETGDTFFLFHRPRRWNPQERMWMGYERKRGKLADLNSLLRGGSPERFSLIVGETAVLANVAYVITLDTDTGLPRDSARELVATMAHPLNRPIHDETGDSVRAGYGILQPRMAATFPGAKQSRYARLFGSEPGIDPYTRAVSDVYQDLFQEGSFIGKGIYDVDAFERVLKDRLPENRILSHDLLEGCLARSGFLSDVQLHEAYPACYEADVSRRHRWIRGDWQIARWILPRPTPGGPRHGE